MKADYLTHDELQHIEYCNKVLKEHEEIVTTIIVSTEAALIAYIDTLKSSVKTLVDTQVGLTKANHELIKSVRETKVVTSNVQELIDYARALEKLGAIIDSGIVEKVLRLRGSNEADNSTTNSK